MGPFLHFSKWISEPRRLWHKYPTVCTLCTWYLVIGALSYVSSSPHTFWSRKKPFKAAPLQTHTQKIFREGGKREGKKPNSINCPLLPIFGRKCSPKARKACSCSSTSAYTYCTVRGGRRGKKRGGGDNKIPPPPLPPPPIFPKPLDTIGSEWHPWLTPPSFFLPSQVCLSLSKQP